MGKSQADSNNLATDFIAANSTINDKGVRNVKQSDYIKFFEDVMMVNAETLKTVAAGHRDLAAGAIRIATDDLVVRGAEAKKNGEDPHELVSEVRITRPDGTLEARVHAARTVNNPQTHQPMTKYGLTRLKISTTALEDDSASKRAEELISKMLGA